MKTGGGVGKHINFQIFSPPLLRSLAPTRYEGLCIVCDISQSKILGVEVRALIVQSGDHNNIWFMCLAHFDFMHTYTLSVLGEGIG